MKPTKLKAPFDCPKCNAKTTHAVRIGGPRVSSAWGIPATDGSIYSLPCGHSWGARVADLDSASLALALLLLEG